MAFGPAYEDTVATAAAKDDWPTYRHDAARSGHASASVPAALRPAWKANLGGRLTSPVVANGKVFLASVHAHTVHALDAASGKPVWDFTAGGRVDSSPTIYQGRVLFGSADGWVYCLRASDGALAWRFRAAPMDQRLTSFEQVESVWPVPGNVLIQGDVLYCVAGRSMFLDGGLRLWRLDPKTGLALSETVLDDRDPKSGENIQTHVSWLNMPPALPDVLSSDGRLVYMRSQPFKLDGTRLPLKSMPAGPDADRGAPPATQDPEHAHLFSPSGFLDDSWWHRTYWLFGSRFVSGWSGYYLAGKATPAGRILVFDDSRIYGFGRKPQYYRWTTQIEHHLFAADKMPPVQPDSDRRSSRESRIRTKKSKSLNPARKPVTVEAWVRADKPRGAILARGGGVHGYALYVQGGRPHFAVRISSNHVAVSAKKRIVGRWAHLAGALTAEMELRIYVDGKLAASAKAPGLIASDPSDEMQVGADENSTVGDYNAPFAFTGLVDEVRIHHRALSAAEIEKRAGGTDADKAKLVLAYSFDDGHAVDASGNKNHGRVVGAASVKGKVGQAMKFTGGTGRGSKFLVEHHWTQDVPLFARAMVLADGKLFVAGPEDLLDEEQAFKQIDDPNVRPKLDEQTTSLEGKKGAMLWAVSTTNGEKLSEHRLDSPPIFDGMAAAGGKLYMATQDGHVICLAGAK